MDAIDPRSKIIPLPCNDNQEPVRELPPMSEFGAALFALGNALTRAEIAKINGRDR